MAAQFRHLALNADDVDRAKLFYESVFGWRFEPWGPPEYYQVRNAGDGVIGALQHRRELKPGVAMAGFEATLAIDDFETAVAAIEAAGGRMVTRPIYIETVGRLSYFEDTEGNLVGVMQYDADAEPRPKRAADAAGQIRYVSLNADDTARCKGFYEAVFGWRFEPWGPPGYYLASNTGEGLLCALHGRREQKRGVHMAGFEVTLAVRDLDASIGAIQAAGGRLLMRPAYIEAVGRLVTFEDSEGNLVSAMQYDPEELARIVANRPWGDEARLA
jgi:predicted enzyme related to lactoylglutathione lyase